MDKRSIYTLRQGPYTTNAQLFEKLKARVETVEEIGETIGEDMKLVEAELKALLEEEEVLEINTTNNHSHIQTYHLTRTAYAMRRM
mmetsp:Transcript_9864/g.29332  ORF Transcript_9864/g.29332 Transcript_9864/m.29332 type:complete len:86 (-) Transcript_9864:839-1096(-)